MKDLIFFEFDKENINNEYTDFDKKIKPKVKFEDFTDEEIEILKNRHDEILKIVHNEVTKYLDDGASTGIDGDDWFPSWGSLSGRFYISSERYYKRLNGGVKIGIQTNFTEIKNDEEMDYLGLYVGIYADSVTAEFDKVNEVDSSSI